jgi:DNA recombination protein RmuC
MIGALFGLLAAYIFFNKTKKSNDEELERLTQSMKGAFAEMSIERLSKDSDELLKQADMLMSAKSREGDKELESKKALIDAQLVNMRGELDRVHKLMTGMEKDREARFSEISEQIKNTAYQTERLSDVTGSLNNVLSSTAKRGQWGERMALDIIRATGMKETVNYETQKTMENGSRPDFTFYLPKGYVVNMDVKFPLDSYIKYCEGEDQEQYQRAFMRDVRQKIKDVKDRGYIDSQENTLDVMLLFLPNESVYEFIYEKDPGIMDLALECKVVLTSPMSLYSVLSVIRQSVENFAIESTSGEMLKLFSKFYDQWNKFATKLDVIGKKLDEAQKAYDELTTTRRNQLQKPLEKIEQLREEKGIDID